MLLHKYGARSDVIPDWQTDIWSQISQVRLLLLESYKHIKSFTVYLNACADVPMSDTCNPFSNLDLN